MRILVMVPHYFGPSRPEYQTQILGSSVEPIGRIAALNEMIVALHAHFGPNRCMFDGKAIASDETAPARHVDIVVVTQRDHNILPQLGLAPHAFETAYVDGNPTRLHFHTRLLLRDRLGSYDFYCMMEDDLIIHDTAFFEKLGWFQDEFGVHALLAPVRFELAHTGTPAKVIIDPELPENWTDQFRRPDQKVELVGGWRGSSQAFRLPRNPHAGCFFLSQEQLTYWAEHPSFADCDVSWVGPIESIGTYSLGKVFNIYKPTSPDPFFLALQHFGARYAVQSTPRGMRRGEPPLLAIAQNALRAAIAAPPEGTNAATVNGCADAAFSRIVEHYIAQGTAMEHRGQVDLLQRKIEAQQVQIDALNAELERRRSLGMKGD